MTSIPETTIPVKGNGHLNWVKASAVAVPTNLGTTAFKKEWRFTYENIPASGIANIVVRLKEASSAEDMALTDEAGHYTTLVRQVNTGSPIQFNIGYPNFAGITVDEHYVMKVYFRKELIPEGMSDADFLNEFSIFISSIRSGDADGAELQPRAGYQLVRNVNATEHSVEFTFPNLYNGIPDFLHTVRAEHRRGSLSLGDSELVKMRPNGNADTDGDGLPDWWERQQGWDPNNPTGRNGRDGDDDADGVINRDEYLFGLNSRLADSEGVPRLTIQRAIPSGWTLSFPTIPGRFYRWQKSPNLTTWENFGTPVDTSSAVDPSTMQTNDAGAPGRGYFRVQVKDGP
jgi:hypothetical protein